jgi:hypothetical protein
MTREKIRTVMGWLWIALLVLWFLLVLFDPIYGVPNRPDTGCTGWGC